MHNPRPRRPHVAAVLITATVFGWLAAAAFAANPPPAGNRPNVVVIVSDDQGYADVGFQGCKDFATPHLDSLAAHGVRFTSGYVTQLMCAPSRAGFLTGRYQNRFGMESNPLKPGEGPPTSEIMLPRLLKPAGYHSGLVGKWHLGEIPEMHPLARGFDEFYGFVGGGHSYLRGDGPSDRGNAGPLEHNGESAPFTGYLTDVLSDAAVDFIDRNRQQPFFLYLAYNAPHVPLQATDPYLERVKHIADEKRRTYAAMTTALDYGVGRVLTALRDRDLERRTLVVFFSDNGGSTGAAKGDKSNGSDNTPLREGKGTLYEGGIRVPMVAQWRGTLAEGTTYDPPVLSADFFATAAALAGVPMPSDRTMDGVNLMPFLLGQSSAIPHERLHWRMLDRDTYAIREGRWKLFNRLSRGPYLYDLENDLGEEHDLREKHPDIADRLQKLHDVWAAELPPLAWSNRGE